MSWTFKQAKFKVGDRVHFPYGRKIGTVTHVGVQVLEPEGRILGFLYRITSYTLTEEQLSRAYARPQRVRREKNATAEVPF